MIWKTWYNTISQAIRDDRIADADAIFNQIPHEKTAAGFDLENVTDLAFAIRCLISQNNNEKLLVISQHLSTIQAPTAGSFERECYVVSHFLLGSFFRSEPVGKNHLEQAVALHPDFYPALIELKAIEACRDIRQDFLALGSGIKKEDWKYKLAASELGMAATAAPAKSGEAICVRGLCSHTTPALIRLLKFLSPNASVYFSTWNDSDKNLLREIEQYANVILVNDDGFPGYSNKNRQIKLSQAALESAKAAGAEFVLLTRSDIALFKSDAPGFFRNIILNYKSHSAMRGRMLIPELFTRKYHYFHPSDMLMFGYTDDVMKFWSAPHENQDGRPLPPEMYLAFNLCKSLGIRHDGVQLSDCWEFLRDFFVIEDVDFLEMLWLKRPDIKESADITFVGSLVTNTNWKNLMFSNRSENGFYLNTLANGMILEALARIPKI